jgi:hypothetical protein
VSRFNPRQAKKAKALALAGLGELRLEELVLQALTDGLQRPRSLLVQQLNRVVVAALSIVSRTALSWARLTARRCTSYWTARSAVCSPVVPAPAASAAQGEA